MQICKSIQGKMINRNESDDVAFKEAKLTEVAKTCIEYEKDLYELIGDHGKQVYNYNWASSL